MSVSELFTAIKAGDVGRVESLLAEDAGLAAARDEGGLSAVLTAAYWHQPEILAALLARGPELTLFEAAAAGDLPRLRELLDAHPELLNSYGADGYYPLGLASYFGHSAAAALLLERGADVNQRATNGGRVAPLHAAAAGQHLEIARMLLDAGAEVSAAQEGGFTPLHSAAQNGQAAMVDLLLAHGADRSAATADGRTPREVALAAGHAELADRL